MGFASFSIRIAWKLFDLNIFCMRFGCFSLLSLGNFHIFGNPKPCFSNSTWKYCTGVSFIDADWKVNALIINVLDLWTKSSKFEFKHLLTTNSWILDLFVFCLGGKKVPCTKYQKSGINKMHCSAVERADSLERHWLKGDHSKIKIFQVGLGQNRTNIWICVDSNTIC